MILVNFQNYVSWFTGTTSTETWASAGPIEALKVPLQITENSVALRTGRETELPPPTLCAPAGIPGPYTRHEVFGESVTAPTGGVIVHEIVTVSPDRINSLLVEMVTVGGN